MQPCIGLIVFIVVLLLVILSGSQLQPETPAPAQAHIPEAGDLYALVSPGDKGRKAKPFVAFFRIAKVEGQGIWYKSVYLTPDGKVSGSDWYNPGDDGSFTGYLHSGTVETVKPWTLIEE